MPRAVSALPGSSFGQALAAERRQLQAAFHELERKPEMDQTLPDGAGNVGLDGSIGIELPQPAELVRREWSVHGPLRATGVPGV